MSQLLNMIKHRMQGMYSISFKAVYRNMPLHKIRHYPHCHLSALHNITQNNHYEITNYKYSFKDNKNVSKSKNNCVRRLYNKVQINMRVRSGHDQDDAWRKKETASIMLKIWNWKGAGKLYWHSQNIKRSREQPHPLWIIYRKTKLRIIQDKKGKVDICNGRNPHQQKY